jgi:tRNA threonylcarbamoyl adenosine modification protein (Sua5/YciO/YrdC/YwlC family)
MPRRVRALPVASEADLEEIARAVGRGDVIALATETLWGLSADPMSGEAIARLEAAKGRSGGKGFLVLVAGYSQLGRLGVEVAEAVREALGRLWPAPVSVVLPLARPIPASRGLQTLALRKPADPGLRDLLRRTGPLASTSANHEGGTPASTADEIERAFGDRLSWIVGEDRPVGEVASTIVDASSRATRLVRNGAGDEAAARFMRSLDGNPTRL